MRERAWNFSWSSIIQKRQQRASGHIEKDHLKTRRIISEDEKNAQRHQVRQTAGALKILSEIRIEMRNQGRPFPLQRKWTSFLVTKKENRTAIRKT